ncbi:zf-HC2 domain-containing protein [Oscillibacter hominis]|uniref:Anti-sigma-W factor RsiW n=1 Tax=Oscillibacter hominis TaxID=2763056 RepID=A0A7G9B2Q3_9FIRM|nr:zf-HC2 domain-containing protein [Oscillibacter hominis]QNL43834.1 zf-HC2 domain-containing protein [Oscillibacter hominis]
MKYCDDYAALISAYLDDELAPEEQSALLTHLKDCPGCRAYLAQLYAIRDSFPTLDETQPPDGLADSVMATIRSQQVRRRARSRKMRTMVPLAACLAFLIVLGGTKGLFSSLDGAGNSAGEAALLSESSGDLSDAPFAAQSSPAGGSSFKGGVEQDTASENGGSSNSASLPKEADPDSGTAAPKSSAGSEDPEAAAPAKTSGSSAYTALEGKVSYFTQVYLTSLQAGSLLDGYTGEDYSDGKVTGVAYTLTEAEYDGLAGQLPELISPEDAEPQQSGDYALVIVTEN